MLVIPLFVFTIPAHVVSLLPQLTTPAHVVQRIAGDPELNVT
jgi:hypothetical protein